MEKKITKIDNFKAIIEIMAEANRDDLVKFCEHEIELLSKKKSNSSNNKRIAEMEATKEAVFTEVATAVTPKTISELQKTSDVLADMSNQKISAMLKKLIEEDRIMRTEEKGKAYFMVK